MSTASWRVIALSAATILPHGLLSTAVAQEGLPPERALRRVTVLEDPDGDRGIGLTPAAVMDDNGYLYMADAYDRTSVTVFDTTGAWIERIGQPGDGPEEFGFIQFMDVDGNGHLRIFDLGNGRITKMSLAPNMRITHIRAFSVPLSYGGAAELRDGSFMVSYHQPTPRGFGRPVWVVDSVGTRIRPVEEHTGPFPPGTTAGSQQWVRFLAPGPSAGLAWVGHSNSYMVKLMDANGTVHRQISRDVPWFPTWSKFRPPNPDQPPQATMVAISPMSKGALWVATSVADREWRSAVRPSNGPFDGFWAPSRRDYWDTVIEIYDARTGHLVDSFRIDEYVMAGVGSNFLLTYRESSSGEPSVELWELDTISPSQQ